MTKLILSDLTIPHKNLIKISRYIKYTAVNKIKSIELDNQFKDSQIHK